MAKIQQKTIVVVFEDNTKVEFGPNSDDRVIDLMTALFAILEKANINYTQIILEPAKEPDFKL